MANIASAQKRIRQTLKRTMRNKARKSRVHGAIRKVEEAVASGNKEAAQAAFRAALGSAGAEVFGRTGGPLLQAVAFGLSHVADARATGEPVLGTVLVTGAAGWVFGWLAERSGSLAAPMLAHLAINEAGALAALAVQHR